MSRFDTTIQLSNGRAVTLTTDRVEALRNEAGMAGDADMVRICDVALGESAPGGDGPRSRAAAQMQCAQAIDDAQAMDAAEVSK